MARGQDLVRREALLLDPLELARLCMWPTIERFRLLLIGAYHPHLSLDET